MSSTDASVLLIYPDDKERLTFVDNLAKSVNKPASQDAYVYATVAGASIQLRLRDEEGAKKIFKLIDALEDSDDVQNVFANFDVSDEVMEKVDA